MPPRPSTTPTRVVDQRTGEVSCETTPSGAALLLEQRVRRTDDK